MFNDDKIPDVVLKVPDLYVGIGDKFLVNGTDFDNAEDLEKLILADKEMNFVVLSDFIWCSGYSRNRLQKYFKLSYRKYSYC